MFTVLTISEETIENVTFPLFSLETELGDNSSDEHYD